MNREPIEILRARMLPITSRELLEELREGVLFTPNIDHLMKLERDEEFARCYEQADRVVCDSRILYFCSQLLPRPLPEAIPGSSFFTAYCDYHRDDADCRVFLLGAAPGVAAEAMRRINERVGRRLIVGEYSPPFGFENDEAENRRISEIIEASGANVVVVGLGAPKQEKWIMANKDRMPGVELWMALGATIDFEAGNVKRAPRWVRRVGMEWFYRFCCEPRRLFRRYFVDDLRFFPLFISRHLLKNRRKKNIFTKF